MILFVFEGDEREPRLYRTLERLYFPKQNDNIICSFGNNIYDLYNPSFAAVCTINSIKVVKYRQISAK